MFTPTSALTPGHQTLLTVSPLRLKPSSLCCDSTGEIAVGDVEKGLEWEKDVFKGADAVDVG